MKKINKIFSYINRKDIIFEVIDNLEKYYKSKTKSKKNKK